MLHHKFIPIYFFLAPPQANHWIFLSSLPRKGNKNNQFFFFLKSFYYTGVKRNHAICYVLPELGRSWNQPLNNYTKKPWRRLTVSPMLKQGMINLELHGSIWLTDKVVSHHFYPTILASYLKSSHYKYFKHLNS